MAVQTVVDAFRSKKTASLWPWVFASPFLIVLGEYFGLSRYGSVYFVFLSGFISFPLVIAVLSFPVVLLRVFIRRHRTGAFAWLALLAVYIPLATTGFVIVQQLRRQTFESLAERGGPLIEVIGEYSRANGQPPENLEQLIPLYLKEIPGTGIRAYPNYDYGTGEQSLKYHDGNPWILQVHTPSGGINFDRFVYYPLQNYPERGESGWYERIADWAYYHE